MHFQNLGKLLLVMSLLWGYFVFAERLMAYWYGNEPSKTGMFVGPRAGSFAPLYWTMVICNFVIPQGCCRWGSCRTITGCVIAAFAVSSGCGSSAS